MKILFAFVCLINIAFAQDTSNSSSNVDMRRLQIESDARKERSRADEERGKADKIRAHYNKRRNDIDKMRGRKNS